MNSPEPRETDIEAARAEDAREPKRSGRFKLIVVVLATVAITLGGVWVVRTYLFPRAFDPVELSAREQVVLDGKLDQLGVAGVSTPAAATNELTPLEPERYEEDDLQREVSFTEKELNGLLANNTNLASRLAIDLSDDLASARLLIPMEEGFPVVGGKTIRIDAGLELSFRNNQPVVALRGISVMGVPIPDAWLGNMRNVDLAQEFGGDRGFWSSFAAGIESLQLDDGELKLRLAE
ncbi:MAG: arginine N-succinyltransferase [Gammaproteobacteria bacterium]